MTYEFLIEGRLPSLNEYINAERSSKYAAAGLKKSTEMIIAYHIPAAMRRIMIKNPVHIAYTWIEPDKRRDKDNIAFGKKFIQDALVKAGVLSNDGWKQITGFTDDFKIGEPGVRVKITEVKEAENGEAKLLQLRL